MRMCEQNVAGEKEASPLRTHATPSVLCRRMAVFIEPDHVQILIRSCSISWCPVDADSKIDSCVGLLISPVNCLICRAVNKVLPETGLTQDED